MAEPKQYAGHHHSSSAGHSIRSPLNPKIIRSQKIATVTSPTEPPRRHDYSAHLADDDDDDDDDDDEEEDDEEADDDDDDEVEEEAMDRAPPLARSHTPGHLATKSHDRRGKPSELSIRHRSQSASSLSASHTPALPTSASSKVSLLSANTLYSNAPATTPTPTSARSHLQLNTKTSTEADREGMAAARRTPGLRSTSAIASKPGSGPSAAQAPMSAPTSTNATPTASSVHKPSSTRTSRSGPRHSHHTNQTHAHIPFPPLIDPRTAPDVPPAPSSGMYWSRAPVSGVRHTALRAHTTTMIGSNVFVFGGCDSRACFNQLYVLDADSFYWSTPHVVGDVPVPLRAMTCTAVGKKLVIFGGGDGPAYYNDVYVLDTVNFRWSRPRIVGDKIPSKRRAHTACLYKNGIYVFGGGDGVRALNDIWRLDVSDMSKMSWKLVSGPSDDTAVGAASGTKGKKDLRPKARGYHTANMVGSKLIIFGGSDGGECFNDVWVWDVDTALWRSVSIPQAHRRLSHTSTIVGSFLFVVGGHDGNEYSNDVLLLNLVTMTWDRRRVYGLPPSGRGYHGTVLHDSRLLVIGGFDGSEVFGEVWMLELAVHAYYSQISHFSIDV